MPPARIFDDRPGGRGIAGGSQLPRVYSTTAVPPWPHREPTATADMGEAGGRKITLFPVRRRKTRTILTTVHARGRAQLSGTFVEQPGRCSVAGREGADHNFRRIMRVKGWMTISASSTFVHHRESHPMRARAGSPIRIGGPSGSSISRDRTRMTCDANHVARGHFFLGLALFWYRSTKDYLAADARTTADLSSYRRVFLAIGLGLLASGQLILRALPDAP
jgi:hypothetical protein